MEEAGKWERARVVSVDLQSKRGRQTHQYSIELDNACRLRNGGRTAKLELSDEDDLRSVRGDSKAINKLGSLLGLGSGNQASQESSSRSKRRVSEDDDSGREPTSSR